MFCFFLVCGRPGFLRLLFISTSQRWGSSFYDEHRDVTKLRLLPAILQARWCTRDTA